MRQFFLIIMLLFPLKAVAQDVTIGDLTIANPVTMASAKMAMAGAGYMSITNTGETDDRLIGAAADYPRVMIHQTQMVDGVATMQHQEYVTIPAGGSVEFAPGGYHVMFMGLQDNPFVIGQDVPVTLTFQEAGEIEVIFTVVARD
jgi:copper(I)-binding protein